MSLVLELQHDAMESKIAVSELLRKALVVTRKLNIGEFENWINLELKGYGNARGDSLPEYRWLKGELKALNPALGVIPVQMSPQYLADIFNKMPTFQPVGEIESIISECQQNPASMLQMSVPQDAVNTIYETMQTNANFPLIFVTGASQMGGVLQAVRTSILDWALQLEKDGILGDGMSFSPGEKKMAEDHKYSIGTFINTMNQSQLQQGTHNSTQQYKFDGTALEGVGAFMKDLSTWLQSSPLDASQRQEVTADIQTVESQLASPKPKISIIGAGLHSVKEVMEQVASSLTAAALSSQAASVSEQVSKVVQLLQGLGS